MKYIRTKDGIYEVYKEYLTGLVSYLDYKNPQYDETLKKNFYLRKYVVQEDIISQADTIEELCDEFVIETDREKYVYNKGFRELQREYDFYDSGYGLLKIKNKYGAIWTEWGLRYVAKMNSEGVMELL